MIKEGKIGPYEASSTIWFLLLLNTLFSSAMAADYGLCAAWQVNIVAGVLTGLGLLFPAYLMKNYPDKSIIEVSWEVLGPIPGFIAGVSFWGFFFIDAVLFLSLEADRITTVYLPQTPISALIVLFLLVAMVGCQLGLETLARSTKILRYFLLFSLLLPFILTYNFWNWNNLFPFWGSGIRNIALGGLSMTGMYTEIIFLAVIYPSIKKQDFKAIWSRPLLLSIIVNTIVTIGALLVFPIPTLNENLFPIVQSARLIFLSRFVQRIDSFFALFWIIVITLKFTLLFYASNVTLARLLRLPYYKPLIFPLGIIVFSLAFLPSNIIQITRFISEIAWRWNWVIAFALPGIILLVHQIKNRNNNH